MNEREILQIRRAKREKGREERPSCRRGWGTLPKAGQAHPADRVNEYVSQANQEAASAQIQAAASVAFMMTESSHLAQSTMGTIKKVRNNRPRVTAGPRNKITLSAIIFHARFKRPKYNQSTSAKSNMNFQFRIMMY